MAIIGLLSLRSFRLPDGILIIPSSIIINSNRKLRLVFLSWVLVKWAVQQFKVYIAPFKSKLADNRWVYYNDIQLGALNQCMLATTISSTSRNTTLSCASKMEEFLTVCSTSRTEQTKHCSQYRTVWSTSMEVMSWYHDLFNSITQ